MAGWVHMKVSIIKGGMAKYGIKNPIFKPSPIVPTYNDYVIFEGISVDESGKQYYLDVNVAYKQACLNAIEYLKSLATPAPRPIPSWALPRCRAISAAWWMSPTPAPPCGCPRRSLSSTSTPMPPARSSTWMAASTCPSRTTSKTLACAGRCAGPLLSFCAGDFDAHL